MGHTKLNQIAEMYEQEKGTRTDEDKKRTKRKKKKLSDEKGRITDQDVKRYKK